MACIGRSAVGSGGWRVSRTRRKQGNQLKVPRRLPGRGQTKYSGIRSFPVKPMFLGFLFFFVKSRLEKKHVGSFIQFEKLCSATWNSPTVFH